MNDTIRVLITDDHFIVREGLRMILETTDNMIVVGEACDGLEALKFAEEQQPDVILMDMQMPNLDGLSAIKAIRKEHPEIAIIILTTYNENDLMLRGLQAGAIGFLLKDTHRDTLLATIEAAANGESLLQPEIFTKLLTHTQQQAAQNLVTTHSSPLTEREQEVLIAAAEGETNKGIAIRLEITERTVKAHLSSVYNKLGVDSRAAAIAIAAQKGWLPPTH